ncbi:MAG: hypothetical protein AAF658_20765, partial [Myxococcota bacterium]
MRYGVAFACAILFVGCWEHYHDDYYEDDYYGWSEPADSWGCSDSWDCPAGCYCDDGTCVE